MTSRSRDPALTRADCLMLALHVIVGDCAALPWQDEDMMLRRCPYAFSAWRRLEVHAQARDPRRRTSSGSRRVA